MTKNRVAIIDDEKLFREGMKLVLEQDDQLCVDYMADNGRELLDSIDEYKFESDVVLLDLSMPVLDGVDTLLELNKRNQAFKVIILTSHYNDSMIIKLLDEGVCGFLSKTENPDEVIKTVKNVINCGFYINDYIIQLIRNRRLLAKNKKLQEVLSAREIDVLKLICEEHTNKEIAQKLYISPRTVEGHRNRILEKTHSKNTAGAVIYAIEHSIVDVKVSKYR